MQNSTQENTYPPVPLLEQLSLGLASLAVFRSLLQNTLLQSLTAAMQAYRQDTCIALSAYSAFVAEVYAVGGNLGDYLFTLVMESENPVVQRASASQDIPVSMQQSLQAELALFSKLSALQLWSYLPAALQAPQYQTTQYDFAEAYGKRLQQAPQKGYGIFAGYHMFSLAADGTLVPVKNPDPQRLSQLTGYQRERRQIVVNTEALLQGLPANNILLYGDAGTGKSSTVKALANKYRENGLRLIEIRKNQLYQIPPLMDKLADNPLKFILFIDDLSFPAEDADFMALKAILEGNIAVRPANMVVYATSNRRHMVRQSSSARFGDDVHLSDTLEEEASLSARFGLTVTFLKPDKALYEEIVSQLAAEYGVKTPLPQLLQQAQAHALRAGGRSPRVARQFVEYMAAQNALEKQ